MLDKAKRVKFLFERFAYGNGMAVHPGNIFYIFRQIDMHINVEVTRGTVIGGNPTLLRGTIHFFP
jgi:hypothetical protein